MTTKPKYFASPADFRRWLEKHHATATDLLLGFYKMASGKGGLTYSEAVDELLCFGWIDGVKRRIDEFSYSHRISPRRPGSTWSRLNLRHVARLTKTGRMHPAGTKVFEARDTTKTGVYSYEKRPQAFPAALEAIFQANEKAWIHWRAQPPGYQRLAIHWVTSAKQNETRLRRLTQLIAITADGWRLDGR